MQLTQIKQLTGTLILKTGLHIGAGDTEMRIGGTDNPVVKNPLDGQPYIPGSSLKGKIRSLLEWQLGLVLIADGKPFSFQHLAKQDNPAARDLLRLFGGAPGGDVENLVKEIGPTRLAFWDCALNAEWLKKVQARNLPSTEAKSENLIDRIKGVADTPPLHRTCNRRCRIRLPALAQGDRWRRSAAAPAARPEAARSRQPRRFRLARLWQGRARWPDARRPVDPGGF